MVLQGVIRPPPDIRAVVDRTALFVSKNGRAFEQRILNSDKGKTTKFAFLHDTSPFHAYYEERIRFHEEGGDEAEEKEEEEEAKKTNEEEEKKEEEDKPKEVAVSTKSKKASAVDPIARALLQQRDLIARHFNPPKDTESKEDESKTPDDTNDATVPPVTPESKPIPTPTPPPPPLTSKLSIPPAPIQYCNLPCPSQLTPCEIDVMKVTAQFTALTSLSNNTSVKPFLDTLVNREWNTSHFGFVKPRHFHFAYFTALVDVYKSILSDVIKRDGMEDIEDEENSTWREMRVCAGDSKTSKNNQGALMAAAHRAEYNRHRAATAEEDGAAVVDWHDFVVLETIPFGVEEIVAEEAPPPPLPPPLPETSALNTVTADDSDDSVDMEEDPIPIVSNYQPRVVANAAPTSDPTTVMDPITGKQVKLADTAEHLRIQLLDPKWAAERKTFLEKQGTSNLVTDITGNLTSFTTAFRGEMEEAGRIAPSVDPQGEKRKREEEAQQFMRQQQMQQQMQMQMQMQQQQHQQVQLPYYNKPPPALPYALPPQPPFQPNPIQPPQGSVLPPAPPVPLPAPPPTKTLELDASNKRQKLEADASISAAQPTTPAAEAIPAGDGSIPVPVPPPVPPVPGAPAVIPPGLPVPTIPAPIAPVLPPAPTSPVPATNALLPADGYLATLSSPTSTIKIAAPSEDYPQWKLLQQTLECTVDASNTSLKDLKQLIYQDLEKKMPMNKMQLKCRKRGVFLKTDSDLLAAYNIGGERKEGGGEGDGEPVLDLVPKMRGKRR